MKLSRVEIQGFKSFADRTVIKFDADIISIVGPNGCGKSNVADAIRWAMGEQSTKRLRAQDMENIIFSGSDTRGPMSMTEVTLFFTNDGKFRHPLYGTCEEISVTRRYFLTNESEYLINNVPCRRKDITEFLSAAGASSKIYSVVEQGRIGWIVISKPEEKRHLIDEAAGVSIYKSKIASIERKTEKTRINLQRISDVIREMESNLAHLKRQAQKAKRFKKYQDELMDLELHNASHKYLGFLQKKSGINRTLEVLKLNKEKTDSRIALTEGEMEVLDSEINQMEETMGRLQEELYAAHNESALLSAGMERGIQDIGDLKIKLRNDLEEIEKIKGKRENSKGENRALLEKREELKIKIEQEGEKLAEITGGLEAMKEQQSRLANEHEENRQKLVGLASKTALLKARQEEGERTTGEVKEKLDEIISKKSGAENKISELDVGIGEKRRVKRQIEYIFEEQKSELSELQELLEQKKEEISRQDKKIEAADEEIFSTRSDVHMIEASLNDARKETENAQNICREISAALLSEKIECAKGYEKAAAAVLEKFLDCVVVSDMDTALSWHLKLLNKNIKNASFIARTLPYDEDETAPPLFEAGGDEKVVPLKSKVTASWDVEELLDRLLRNVYVVDDVSYAAALHRQSKGKATFITRAGETISPKGVLFAAGRRSSRELNARLESNIRAQKEKLEDLTEKRTELSRGRDELRVTIKSTVARIEGLNNKMHETEKSLIRVQQEIDLAVNEINSLNCLIAELNRKSENASARKSVTENEIKDISDLVPTLEDDAAALEAAQKITAGRIEEVRRCIEDKMILMGSHTSTTDSLEKESVEMEGSLEKLQQTIEDLNERSTALENEVFTCTRNQGRKIAETFLGAERNEEIKFNLKKLNRDIEELKNSLNDRKFKSREKETFVRSLRKDMDENEQEIFEVQTELITINGEVEKISQNINLRWQMKLEEAVYNYHSRPAPDKAAEERIAELTKILERMAPVNLLAIEDYRKTEEKYRFYLEEKTDLEEAIDKFKIAITKMNREYKRKFIEAFEKINENFKRIFPLLFCGGHAYLELLDPTKVLESGVEIKAQPPGKKLGNLEMMSGGEKALTAISLIFSIFNFRPSPFCILDEVDAPLDDSNVKRFNDLLRSMTSSSQFILMTHKKLTMQCSDILYGITMQEPGISGIMSTKIEKAGTSAEQLTAVA